MIRTLRRIAHAVKSTPQPSDFYGVTRNGNLTLDRDAFLRSGAMDRQTATLKRLAAASQAPSTTPESAP